MSKPSVDGLQVGARFLAAGEYDLAIDAFNRSAVQDGVTADVLVALGSAHLGLGQLGPAEDLFRKAIDLKDDWPEPWNNLGVVLMERRQPARAAQMFKRAYALDSGHSDAIRNNLMIAQARADDLVSDDIEPDTRMTRTAKGSVSLTLVNGEAAQTNATGEHADGQPDGQLDGQPGAVVAQMPANQLPASQMPVLIMPASLRSLKPATPAATLARLATPQVDVSPSIAAAPVLAAANSPQTTVFAQNAPQGGLTTPMATDDGKPLAQALTATALTTATYP
jgi:hypothetical protein